MGIHAATNIKCFLRAKRLEQASHVWCSKENIIQNVLANKPTCKRPREKPLQRWKGRVNSNIKMIDVTANFETATDHDMWRGLIEATKGLDDP